MNEYIIFFLFPILLELRFELVFVLLFVFDNVLVRYNDDEDGEVSKDETEGIGGMEDEVIKDDLVVDIWIVVGSSSLVFYISLSILSFIFY